MRKDVAQVCMYNTALNQLGRILHLSLMRVELDTAIEIRTPYFEWHLPGTEKVKNKEGRRSAHRCTKKKKVGAACIGL